MSMIIRGARLIDPSKQLDQVSDMHVQGGRIKSLDNALKRSLSAASAALETSSRRKISLFEYKEWIINCSSCFTSVWKP